MVYSCIEVVHIYYCIIEMHYTYTNIYIIDSLETFSDINISNILIVSQHWNQIFKSISASNNIFSFSFFISLTVTKNLVQHFGIFIVFMVTAKISIRIHRLVGRTYVALSVILSHSELSRRAFPTMLFCRAFS